MLQVSTQASYSFQCPGNSQDFGEFRRLSLEDDNLSRIEYYSNGQEA